MREEEGSIGGVEDLVVEGKCQLFSLTFGLQFSTERLQAQQAKEREAPGNRDLVSHPAKVVRIWTKMGWQLGFGKQTTVLA